jgi:hypothetical protein
VEGLLTDRSVRRFGGKSDGSKTAASLGGVREF